MAKKKQAAKPAADPMTAVLATFRKRDATGFEDAWVGLEPTFQTRKSIKKWEEMSERGEEGENEYFLDDYMLGTQKRVAKAICAKYEKRRKKGDERCMFDRVELREELDQWGVRRMAMIFKWPKNGKTKYEPFKVRFTLDPETFEYSIKPVPVAWFYDPRFDGFMQEFLFDVPAEHGLTATIAHGGAQFSTSAKTYMTGSLLADDIATRLNHPELSLWVMDWPNPDDRAFRCTWPRFRACKDMIEKYWAGAFHPRAIGELTVEDVYLNRGFGPASDPPKGLMDAKQGPKGSGREVFQTNFAFGRAFRMAAQNIHPGYWQAAHPKAEGYRPDQIMRYSEMNANRLQIAGELHVKSGKVLDEEDVRDLDEVIDIDHLYMEASWEDRGQMGRTSGRDFIEALLLDIHAAKWLSLHPHVKIIDSLLQDQLMGDGEATVKKHGGAKALADLKKEARVSNAESSEGRVKSDWIEPETLLWAAWNVLPKGERAAIAEEIVSGFVERVEQAASVDPRRGRAGGDGDPMEWHRHRIHPALWEALDGWKGMKGPVKREFDAFTAKRKEYLGRRPVYSHLDGAPPWEPPKPKQAKAKNGKREKKERDTAQT